MSARVYRLLLRLLPGDRRARYGEQMALAFDELSHRRPGPSAYLWAWISEIAGLLRFALREWSSRFGARIDRAFPRFGGHRPQLASEIRWAWRGVRGRGWRGVLVIGLLALAIAANTIVFAAADSFVFDRVQYLDAARLVEIGETKVFGWSNAVWPDAVPVWRSYTDLFSAFHTYQAGGGAATYLKGGGAPRFVGDARVSPGLLDMLGARPLVGRLFVSSDAHAPPATVSIVAEEIARQEFGSPERALGQTLRVWQWTTTIIGVLPAAFRFPSGAERIWTPLDEATQPKRTGSSSLARMAPGLTFDGLNALVKSRAAGVQSHLTIPHDAKATIEARAISPALVDPRMKRIFLLLCAAAGCLLLVACANVINLELATALARVRTYAVGIALGASSGSLLRTALLEGAIALFAAAALGAALAHLGIAFLSSTLPATMTSALANQLDFDRRAFLFMIAIAAVTWLVTSLPVAVVSLRTNVLETLKLDARTLSSSRGGTRVRQALTIVEVAMTVLLLAGALLSARSYAALLAIPKGFDTTSVVSLTLRQAPDSKETDKDLQDRLLGALKSRADVLSASVVDASPPGQGGAIAGNMQIIGRPNREGVVTLAGYAIDLDYFKTMRLPLRSGREIEAGDPPTYVVVDEGFARRFWPNGDALGARFNMGGASFSGAPEMEIIGIAAHMRTQRDSVSAASDDYFPLYKRLFGKYAPLSYAVRLADPSAIGDLTSMVRTLAPGARVRSEFVYDRYANMFANEMLAASIMSAFGLFAFLVAIAGIYGVMAFLVAGRTREIGIRMALGADRGAIRRLVLGSSARLVVAGAVLGVAGASLAARWAGSLLFGVTPADPLTYLSVTAAVVVTALIATWQPARQAARVDPSKLLRE